MKNIRIFILAMGLICAAAYGPGAKAAVIDVSFGLPADQLAASTDSALLLVSDAQDERRGKAHSGKGVRKDGGEQDKDAGSERWKAHHKRMMERVKQLPPEQQEEARQRLEDMRVKREKMREELKALPPEERKARMHELRSQYDANRKEQGESFRKKFRKRWEGASPEERAAFCDRAAEHCDEGRAKACDFVSDACGE